MRETCHKTNWFIGNTLKIDTDTATADSKHRCKSNKIIFRFGHPLENIIENSSTFIFRVKSVILTRR